MAGIENVDELRAYLIKLEQENQYCEAEAVRLTHPRLLLRDKGKSEA